jgi:hypothetical protein
MLTSVNQQHKIDLSVRWVSCSLPDTGTHSLILAWLLGSEFAQVVVRDPVVDSLPPALRDVLLLPDALRLVGEGSFLGSGAGSGALRCADPALAVALARALTPVHLAPGASERALASLTGRARERGSLHAC